MSCTPFGGAARVGRRARTRPDETRANQGCPAHHHPGPRTARLYLVRRWPSPRAPTLAGPAPSYRSQSNIQPHSGGRGSRDAPPARRSARRSPAQTFTCTLGCATLAHAMKHSRLPIPLRLLRYALPYKRRIAFVWCAVAGLTFFQILGPQLGQYAIDHGLNVTRDGGQVVAHPNTRTLAIAAILITAAAIFRGIFQFIQTYTAEWLSQRVAYDIRNDIYDHLQRLSFAYHDKAQTGQIMQRATQDVEGIRMFINMGVIRLVYVVALLLTVLSLMLLTDVKLALLSWVFIPPTAFIAVRMTSKLRPIWLEVQNLQGR